MRGILINRTVHTANNLNLVMTYKDLPAPTPQTYTVEVPGRNGSLDLTDALTGDVAYNNRTLTFKFVGDGSRETVLSLIDTMLMYHGTHIRITTDDYPEWHYEGRATVKYTEYGNYVEFELTVDALPFRFSEVKKGVTVSNVSKHVTNLTVNGLTVVPTITVSDETTIRIFNRDTGYDVTYNLSAGTYEDIKLRLKTGYNVLTITSAGTVTIAYYEVRF